MALIACPECKGQVSDQAPACPHCGFVLKAAAPAATPSLLHRPITLPWLSKVSARVKPDISRLWRESKRSLTLLAVVILVTLILGAITGASLDRSAQREVMQFLEKAMGADPNPTFFGQFSSLFIHNLTVALILLGAGLWLRALPGIIAAVNGFVVGLVLASVAGVERIPFVVTFIALVPHGVFEVPAVAASAGLSLRLNSWKRLTPDQKLQAEDVRWVARCFWLVAIFLVIAAAIEAALIAGFTPGPR